MEQGRISSFQMALLLYPLIVATADLMIPTTTFKYAQRDLWLSPLWASVAGLLAVWLAVRMERFYPGETLMQYLVRILGTGLGKAVGLLFLFYYLLINGNIIKVSQELVTSNFLNFTPNFVVISGTIFISGCAVRGGLEVIARSSQVLMPIVVLLLILVFVMLIPELEIKRMFPVLAKGIGPSLMGAIIPVSWFTHCTLVSYLLPYLRDREKGQKWAVIAVIISMFVLMQSSLFSLLLFGNITGNFTFPVMQAARFISIADFLEHLESLVVVIWIAGVYLKISIYYYVLVLGTAQWLNLSNYKPIVFPLGVLLLMITLWIPSLQEVNQFVSKVSWSYPFIMHILIPMLLFLTVIIRNKMFPRKPNTQ